MSKPRREILIRGPDKTLILSKATRIHIKDEGRQFISLDQLKDGTWRLVYTTGVVDQWKTVEGLEMIRKDD